MISYWYFILDIIESSEIQFGKQSHSHVHDVCNISGTALGDLQIFSPLILHWHVQGSAQYLEGISDGWLKGFPTKEKSNI